MDTATKNMPQEDRTTYIGSAEMKLDNDKPAHLLADTSYDLTDIDKQTEIIEKILNLQTELIGTNSERERLKIKLDESNRTSEILRRELDECKLTIFQNNEDSKKVFEEVQKNRKLEEDYVKLMSNFLNLSERYEKSRQDIYDSFMAKTDTINNSNSLLCRDAIKHELEHCKSELHMRQADICLLTAKLRNLEEENGVKEKCITELKKSLDDAKVTHGHEITVLHDYIQCLKNTITSYENTLTTYIDGVGKPVEECPRPTENNDA